MKEERKKRSSGCFSDAMTESERVMKQRKRGSGSREARPAGLAKRPCDFDRLVEAVWIDSRPELSDFAIALMTET